MRSFIQGLTISMLVGLAIAMWESKLDIAKLKNENNALSVELAEKSDAMIFHCENFTCKRKDDEMKVYSEHFNCSDSRDIFLEDGNSLEFCIQISCNLKIVFEDCLNIGPYQRDVVKWSARIETKEAIISGIVSILSMANVDTLDSFIQLASMYMSRGEVLEFKDLSGATVKASNITIKF